MQISAGEIIKAKREEKHISLQDFARDVGISPGYLSQLENGKKSNPKLEVLVKIAQLLGIELDTLLGVEQEDGNPSLVIPSLIRLVIAKDRNLKVLEDKDIQKKISNLLDRILESKYLVEDKDLYNLFLEDVIIQVETALKRYIAMGMIINRNI